jgi:hypothetical protein
MNTKHALGPKGQLSPAVALPARQPHVRQGARDAVFPAALDGPEGKSIGSQIIKPLPPELPGLPPRPRVLQLTDGDCVSHGLADGTGSDRAAAQEVRSCFDKVHTNATLLDPNARIRCAISTETATHHLDVLTTARNNLFTIRRGLDGVGQALLEELTDLIQARMIATRPGRKRPTWLADLVILVAQDGIYAPPVIQLRLLGIPTWLLVPGLSAAASLRSACCAVSYVGPGRLA